MYVYLSYNRCPMDISFIIGVLWISLLYQVSHGYLSNDKCPRNIPLKIGVLWISLLYQDRHPKDIFFIIDGLSYGHLSYNKCPMDISLIMTVPWIFLMLGVQCIPLIMDIFLEISVTCISLSYYVSHRYLSFIGFLWMFLL